MYDSKTKTIVSLAKKGYSLDTETWGRDAYLKAKKTKRNTWTQKFSLKGDYLVNERGKVADVYGAKDRDHAKVIVWKKGKKLNQKWKVEYVYDQSANELIADKPFNIVSKMKGQRLLTLNGNNFVIADRNNNANQVFKYDSKSNSIICVSKKGWSMGIDANNLAA